MVVRLRTVVLMLFAITAATVALGQTTYHGRKAWTLKNDKIQVVVAPGGGHIASLTLVTGRGAGLNPLWLPPWKSVEPRDWNRIPGYYGDPPGAPLLASILGHSICLDFFGSPSDEETKAGIPVHGEAPVANWTMSPGSAPTHLAYSATLPNAHMRVTRDILLTPHSSAIWIWETVRNGSAFDRPIGWQEHISFGPPFLEKGASFFDLDGTWSTVDPREFSKGQRLRQGGEFEWPNAPGADGNDVDLREWPKGTSSSDFTVSLIDPGQKWGWFTAINAKRGLLVGYIWPRSDWPWAANWEENHFRSANPWKKKAVARGIEFGTSPFAYSRRDTVTIGKLHEVPTYRWLPAKTKQTVGYAAFLAPIPEGTTGVKSVDIRGNEIVIVLDGVDKTITLPVARGAR